MSGKVVRKKDTFDNSVAKIPRRRAGLFSPPSVYPEDRRSVRATRFLLTWRKSEE